ncbi:MAG: LytTR family transcriptional regulator DNA-binding domain-containing protein [Balneolaceae bacterium]|nr:LytTR family transcriptional regulator DNA-binding domain-containing protein [Balneolaceae bacterium]MBO6546328.1 LytTR family transcriptional regulator DNA-binding domain-containing protein [Balneolaceae bacterium]MBO6648687.1 LytTR family transcriptional regulator DNA-binding domain-containing protein [Balneolaceae bacterium]
MNCIIIDDEQTARMALKKLCEKTGSVKVLSEFENPADALSFIQNTDLDFIFLDIHMPELTGAEFVKSVSELPDVIMTTTDTSFALEAFEYNVIDYLVKPITMPRFLKALDKLKTKKSNSAEEVKADSIFVNINSRLVKLNFDDIQVIEAKGDYVQIKTEDKKHTVHITLKKIEEKLPGSVFLKVHRSYIINLNKIVDIEDNSILIAEEIIPISRGNKETLLSKLNML